MVELDRQHPLYDAHLPVILSGPDASEERRTSLAVRILMGTRATPGPKGQRERLLHVEITDEASSLFLQTLQVGEEDFHVLKRDQALLVDFADFPDKFIELLEAASGSAGGDASPKPRFLARLVQSADGDGTFSIVEANLFKELTHLSLRFRRGDDRSVQQYLTGRLRQVKAENASLSSQLAGALEQLKADREAAAKATDEASELRSARGAFEREMRAMLEMEMLRARELHATELADAKAQAAKERRQLEDRLRVASEELSVAREALSQHKASSLEALSAAEADLREAQRGLRVAEQAAAASASEADAAREENRALSAARFELEKETHRLSLQLDAARTEVEDNKALAAQGAAAAAAAHEGKESKEETLRLYKESVATLQEKLRAGVAEINKGNGIISRLQTESRHLRQKLKLKTDLLDRQEAALKDLGARAEALGASEAEVRRKEREHKERLDAEASQNEALRRKVSEAEALLESNQQVIAWLNKQLNEMNEAHFLAGGPAGGASGAKSPEGAEAKGRRAPAAVSPQDDELGGNGDLAEYLDSLAPGGMADQLGLDPALEDDYAFGSVDLGKEGDSELTGSLAGGLSVF